MAASLFVSVEDGTVLRVCPAGEVAAFVFLNPPLATLWAWLFEGQPIRPPFVIGALVLLAGVAAIVLPPSRPRENESSA
jgi:drug/metabolite transporter (DMT)-like permease